MDSQTKSEYEAKSHRLRLDLKKWETDWAQSHDGKKPGRNDIKENKDIAQKYKLYQKYRDIIDGKVPVPQPPQNDGNTRKRRTDNVPPSTTPLKKQKFAETPSNNRIANPNDLEATPTISRKLFSPSGVTSLGPTPQRDGRVLGLFDLLVEREIGTPSKKEMGIRSEVRGDVGVTPRKARTAPDSASSPELSRTPMSASKRQMLDTFMTPLKKRDGNMAGATTPSSVSKLQFETPQFLKRHALPTVDEKEDGKFDAPAPLRLPRKPLGRGLSEIVASLRKVEEEQMDDDLDALREIENDEMGGPPQLSRPKTAPAPPTDDILGRDIPIDKLPLGGFDDEGMYDSPEEGNNRDGQPRKLFKKKGQKRTTRKVNIKPVWNKRPTLPAQEPGSEDEVDTLAAGSKDIDKTQDDNDAFEAPSGSESDGDTKSARKTAKKPGVVKKAARKVNELAHANFQRLKLRQNGAKGGPGYNSRFRRRR